MKLLNSRKLLDKRILIVSPEAWSHSFVSKHHYALELAKFNKVYFLNPPSKTGKFFKPKVLMVGANLFVIDYKPIIRGVNFFSLKLRLILTKIQIKIFEMVVNSKFDVVWNFETSRFYDFDAFNKNVLKILHIVDLNQDFHFEEAAKSADICICTTDFIKTKLIKHNKNVFKIHHGYNSLTKSDDMLYFKFDNNRVKAGYVGNLNIKYIDYELIYKLITTNPNVDFYFAGPLDYNNIEKSSFLILDRLKVCPNFKLLGPIPSASIHGFLKNMDILLVIYKVKEHLEQLASPHKLMEYFGSGKVIVATYTDEYKDKRHLLAMNNENDNYLLLFKNVVDNLDFYNSNENQRSRIDFANSNRYICQLNKIEQLVIEYV
ncbi:hypothetical protein [Sabulibacter ruber]|uniref:hypothetical protein n=1 Tax=Sabulibacter ruber TaxID=2811901 RepID=UPI001A97CAB1|nr:hypothetical protein [Sabulibacter ruber]